MKRRTQEIHIKLIKAGDTVIHEGKEMTVNDTDLTFDPFMGWKLFGDCYRLGYKPVILVIFEE